MHRSFSEEEAPWMKVKIGFKMDESACRTLRSMFGCMAAVKVSLDKINVSGCALLKNSKLRDPS